MICCSNLKFLFFSCFFLEKNNLFELNGGILFYEMFFMNKFYDMTIVEIILFCKYKMNLGYDWFKREIEKKKPLANKRLRLYHSLSKLITA